MPLSHDELDELRAISQTHRSYTLVQSSETRRKQAQRRKWLLLLLLGITSLVMLVANAEH